MNCLDIMLNVVVGDRSNTTQWSVVLLQHSFRSSTEVYGKTLLLLPDVFAHAYQRVDGTADVAECPLEPASAEPHMYQVGVVEGSLAVYCVV